MFPISTSSPHTHTTSLIACPAPTSPPPPAAKCAASTQELEQGSALMATERGALLLDFHSGWSFPRHLYSGDVYRVWGNRPYEAGDYLTDAVLDLLYPGYQDSSYFHDESGFIAPTPFGDIADCLLSDAPSWLLARYPLVIVGGELSRSRETLEKLLNYAANGGHLVITAGNLTKLSPGNPPEGPFEFKDSHQMFVGGKRIGENCGAVGEQKARTDTLDKAEGNHGRNTSRAGARRKIEQNG